MSSNLTDSTPPENDNLQANEEPPPKNDNLQANEEPPPENDNLQANEEPIPTPSPLPLIAVPVSDLPVTELDPIVTKSSIFVAIAKYILVGMMAFGPFISLQFLPLNWLFVMKWMTSNSSCIYGYTECKLRGCKRNEGYINQVIDGVYQKGIDDPLFAGTIAGLGMLALLSFFWPKKAKAKTN
jgi:hypothetical protein